MAMELYFTLGVIAFSLIAVGINVEHYIAVHWFQKDSTLMRALQAFERRHPALCDRDDLFYCFFKRDRFTLP